MPLNRSSLQLPKPWLIQPEMEQRWALQIERNLNFFNRYGNGNFYIVDYYRKRIFSCSASAIVLSRHPKSTVETHAMEEHFQALKPKERNWLMQINEEVLRVFYKYNEGDRMNLEYSFDLTSKTVNQKEIILRYKVTPFELDANGNLWMALIFASESPMPIWTDAATIVNFNNGDKYEFNGKTFVKSKDRILTDEEISILRCLSKGMLEKQISDVLNIPKSSLGRKKQSAFCKLGAKTAAEATYLARNMHII
ncbi:MAG: LuxR C-terminal-related transcriptional regulator [Bacteroidales bacterium]|jgi:DNA-binding CsgD family transcriptional regulator|nr:LuxR C-terminal-related transcriptional regulator [Bacteroidales bacterium]